MLMIRILAAYSVLAAVTFFLPATAVAISVGSIANIYGAGQATPPGGATFGAGVLPPSYTFAPAAGQVLHVTNVGGFVGSVIAGNYAPNLDGHAALAVGTQMTAQQGIAGIQADAALFLTGVFLDNNSPTGPPPAALDFSSAGIG